MSNPDPVDVDSLQVEAVDVAVVVIEAVAVVPAAVEAVEVAGVAGASELQLLQEYLSLDGGRAADVYDGMESLDGGGAE